MERNNNKIILSILICSLHSRKYSLQKLIDNLNIQISDKSIEILTSIDNGELTVGNKRNILLDQAKGEYIVFIDDDDEISNSYVDLIYNKLLLNNNVDCIGIKGIIIDTSNNIQKEFRHSVEYAGWYESNGIYYRTPNHLNPVKRNLALMAKFPNACRFGEDLQYSKSLRNYLKTEIFIDEYIYKYLTKGIFINEIF